MKSISSILLIFSVIAMTLASCEEQCDPVDVDELNGIFLRFDTGSSSDSFSPSELDSVYFIRFQESFLDSFNFPVDTVQLYQLGWYDNDFGLRISRDYPRGLVGGPPYYTEYKYLFMSHGQDWQVRLQHIEVDGGYLDDCEYETRLKRFVLNDDTLTRTGNTSFVQVFKD